MKNYEDWKSKYEAEILQAEAARRVGNEGKARVCARRAAGIVVSEYFRRHDILMQGKSSIEKMNYLISQPRVEDGLKEILGHLLLRVTKEHTLPIDIDLIVETHKLKAYLIEDL